MFSPASLSRSFLFLVLILANSLLVADPPGNYKHTCKDSKYDTNNTLITAECDCQMGDCDPDFGGDWHRTNHFYVATCSHSINNLYVGNPDKNVCMGTPGNHCYSGYLVCDHKDWKIFHPGECSDEDCEEPECRISNYEPDGQIMHTSCRFQAPWGDRMEQTRQRTLSDCKGEMKDVYGEISCSGDRPLYQAGSTEIQEQETAVVVCKDHSICVLSQKGSMYCSGTSICAHGKDVACHTKDQAVCKALGEVTGPFYSAQKKDEILNRETGILVCRGDAECRLSESGEMYCAGNAFCNHGSKVTCYAYDDASCESGKGRTEL
ncbi:hypothetical protein [Endozoicomonas arenosclerae]|uniref:hypothetical protein n=1 Tax=Endozoicomonas arenosclerae TaxID=1633495 RepID=UPI000785AF4C|nr:hypothetical protein [Endozoicomonas arenosclerae]